MENEMSSDTAARLKWTKLHGILAGLFLIGVVFVGVLAFADIFLSVTRLLRAWWHGAAWTIIALGEGSFTTCYIGWMLLDLRAKPTKRAQVYLFGYLSLFVVTSLVLMLYAGRSGAPDLLSHGLAVVAFYGLLIFLKVLVKTLFADPVKRAEEEALADARRYAIDLCRAEKGPLWRWRIPALLKRNIRIGRFPDEVHEAVVAVVAAGRSSGWQEDVRAYVFGPDGLSLRLQARAASERAAAGIAAASGGPATDLAGQQESAVQFSGSGQSGHKGQFPVQGGGDGSGSAHSQRPSRRRRSRRRSSSVSGQAAGVATQAEAFAILAVEPEITGKELGIRLGGLSEGYGCRLKKLFNETVAGPDQQARIQ